MPDPITRIVFRKGNFNEKQDLILLQGEPGYVIDAKRLFIGDGTTFGGVPVGMRNLGIATFGQTSTNLTLDQFNMRGQTGDIIFDTATSCIFALTGTNPGLVADYAKFGATIGPDNSTIVRNNNLFSVKQNGLNATYFASAAIGRGLERINSNQTIQISDPSSELTFSGNTLSITPGGVGNDKLANMPPNTIKARVAVVGAPQDIPFSQIANLLVPFVNENVNIASVPVGTILDFAGVTPPEGYLMCNGQAVARDVYANLFSVIGTLWGAGDGNSTFNVPDLRRKTTVGSGGTGTTVLGNSVGQIGGQESILLTANQTGIRSHNHSFNITTVLQTTFNIPINHQHYFGYGGDDAVGYLSVKAIPTNINQNTTIEPNLWLGAERRQTIAGSGGGYSNFNWDAGVTVSKMYVTSEAIPTGDPTLYTITLPLEYTNTTTSLPEQAALEAHNNIQPSAVVNKIIKT